jgi:hypothetical protein
MCGTFPHLITVYSKLSSIPMRKNELKKIEQQCRSRCVYIAIFSKTLQVDVEYKSFKIKIEKKTKTKNSIKIGKLFDNFLWVKK